MYLIHIPDTDFEPLVVNNPADWLSVVTSAYGEDSYYPSGFDLDGATVQLFNVYMVHMPHFTAWEKEKLECGLADGTILPIFVDAEDGWRYYAKDGILGEWTLRRQVTYVPAKKPYA